MNIKKIIFFILTFFIVHRVPAEPCSGTIQIFFDMDIKSGTLQKKAAYRHKNIRYCESSDKLSSNAEIFLLDKKLNKVRSYRMFIQNQFFLENGDTKKGLNRIPASPRKSRLHFKFADDSEFVKAKNIQIKFDNGKTYGPTKI